MCPHWNQFSLLQGSTTTNVFFQASPNQVPTSSTWTWTLELQAPLSKRNQVKGLIFTWRRGSSSPSAKDYQRSPPSTQALSRIPTTWALVSRLRKVSLTLLLIIIQMGRSPLGISLGIRLEATVLSSVPKGAWGLLPPILQTTSSLSPMGVLHLQARDCYQKNRCRKCWGQDTSSMVFLMVQRSISIYMVLACIHLHIAPMTKWFLTQQSEGILEMLMAWFQLTICLRITQWPTLWMAPSMVTLMTKTAYSRNKGKLWTQQPPSLWGASDL